MMMATATSSVSHAHINALHALMHQCVLHATLPTTIGIYLLSSAYAKMATMTLCYLTQFAALANTHARHAW